MTGILDQIRNTRVEDLEGVRSDFDDLPRGHFSAAKNTGMVRIVEGADDLVHPMAGRSGGGVARNRPALPVIEPVVDSVTGETEHDGGYTCDNPRCCPVPDSDPKDARTPRQVELMRSLHMQLAELDHDTAEAAVAYTTRMTLAGKWTPGREGNASSWIGRMIAKVRELKAANRTAQAKAEAKPGFDKYEDIPSGYYALPGEGDDIKFYRVNHKDGKGQYEGRHFTNVDACASDNRHPIKVWATRKAILDGIRAMGWKASTALYGSKIGSCGRCHRSLTDAESRARGIGPDCWSKM
jgi:hypothetical protein